MVHPDQSEEGYSSLSETGRAVAETVELSARYEYLTICAADISGYRAPRALKTEIEKRMGSLSDAEKNAVADLRNKLRQFGITLEELRTKIYRHDHPIWSQWLQCHLEKNPNDAIPLLRLEKEFHGLNIGKDRVLNWKMNHVW